MTRFTLCILREEPDEPSGPIKVGEDDGDIIVDCPRKAGRCLHDCRVYRKDRTTGGRHVHRGQRTMGARNEAISEHRFLGEPGT